MQVSVETILNEKLASQEKSVSDEKTEEYHMRANIGSKDG